MLTSSPPVEVALRLGDTCLVLAQRLGEWCGHAPVLEEDIALANIALDLLGHARGLLTRAGELEGTGRDEDDLAYLREAAEFRNVALAELPNGDFGKTILRQFFYDAYAVPLWSELASSTDPGLAGIAAKAVKESTYHLRHSGGWVVRLGDGTEESHARMQSSLDLLLPYTRELFTDDEVDATAAAAGVAPLPSSLRVRWRGTVETVLGEGGLRVNPDVLDQPAPGLGGRQGVHTEHLSQLLAEMQVVHRAHPGAAW
ncbi:MAG: phenylacetate-CoA oxygenase subunit PaaC [Actinomycetota bacterium]|nr:phenylacetate-CoA oxygenase subunit PaaC [Actinomycetota bacterium]